MFTCFPTSHDCAFYFPQTFLLGAVAKLGATVTTYPLLVVKSRLQAKQVTTGDKRQQYKGFPSYHEMAKITHLSVKAKSCCVGFELQEHWTRF